MAHERVFEAFVPTYSGRFGGSHIIHLYRGSIRIYIPLDVNIKDAPVTILERVLSVEGPQSSPELWGILRALSARQILGSRRAETWHSGPNAEDRRYKRSRSNIPIASCRDHAERPRYNHTLLFMNTTWVSRIRHCNPPIHGSKKHLLPTARLSPHIAELVRVPIYLIPGRYIPVLLILLIFLPLS